MEERYEIREKVGQGGLGKVYRAWDKVLKREVAVKRIISGEDEAHRMEATKQMTKETGALASLQHPNIVTIYDVGADEDGPFVVMELIVGHTLDELVVNAPLTWVDFHELALQIQEGLIAAQDLGLVHRDLKPSNVMLKWLPSGRFQAKIVDFGLAKFSPKPSPQTVDHRDSVFGSIYFMGPEQFERGPIDGRLDMYSIGCVYYFVLTGRNPFDGDTGVQVMASHLSHRVIPLSELRPDIPKWATDWVMWHINLQPAERPENARESLKCFMLLESAEAQRPQQAALAATGPAVPIAQVTSSVGLRAAGPRRRQQSGGTASVAAKSDPAPATPSAMSVTAPQRLAPPSGAPPSIHTTELVSLINSNTQTAVNSPVAASAAPGKITGPNSGPAPSSPSTIAALAANAAMAPTAAQQVAAIAAPPPPVATAPIPSVVQRPVGGVGAPATAPAPQSQNKPGFSDSKRNMLALVGGVVLLVILILIALK
jgi:serine/threonine protein kinase